MLKMSTSPAGSLEPCPGHQPTELSYGEATLPWSVMNWYPVGRSSQRWCSQSNAPSTGSQQPWKRAGSAQVP